MTPHQLEQMQTTQDMRQALDQRFSAITQNTVDALADVLADEVLWQWYRRGASREAAIRETLDTLTMLTDRIREKVADRVLDEWIQRDS